MSSITLEKLNDSDRNQFVIDNQEAFRYGAIEEFGFVTTILKSLTR